MENENSDNFVEASGSDNSLQTDSQAAPLCQEIANERNAAHLVSTGHLELDYGHLAKKAFDYGPIAVRNYSKTALYIYLLVEYFSFYNKRLLHLL
ncbi:putative amino acid permease F59B2.2 [Trichinella spiralis]|uniref:putative amino acid permease F59B2.2 n=1 Tax=Trichinella spiralis TaxID=6334 RepID=UPI0001EFE263|nr:putative amino acid permease F59B2.2 [Trichinella spiralis]